MALIVNVPLPVMVAVPVAGLPESVVVAPPTVKDTTLSELSMSLSLVNTLPVAARSSSTVLVSAAMTEASSTGVIDVLRATPAAARSVAKVAVLILTSDPAVV